MSWQARETTATLSTYFLQRLDNRVFKKSIQFSGPLVFLQGKVIWILRFLWFKAYGKKPYFECFLSVKIIIGTTILALNLYYSRKSIDVYLLEQASLTYLCKHISIVQGYLVMQRIYSPQISFFISIVEGQRTTVQVQR